MARTVGSNGARTAQAILEAGARLIYRHGYEAMSLRRLAEEVGLQSGSLYNHIESKQALLHAIVLTHMQDLTAALARALDGVEGPVARLEAFSAFHLGYHMARREQVVIANLELRSLDPDHRAEIVALRESYERVLTDILVEGHAAGVFRVAEPRVTTFALIALLTGICMWYRPDGPLSPEDLIRVHVGLVLDGVRGGGDATARGAG